MIRLAHIVDTHVAELIAQDGHRLLPSQLAALRAFQICRSSMSPKMQLGCDHCQAQSYLPHSCGHRHCPHCQAHESQRWIDQQSQKLIPGNYFMVTFTLPAQFRTLAWGQQRVMYDLITRSAWETVSTFSRNDRKLRGTTGAVTVLHTHNRRLDYHPHVHLVMPSAAFDNKRRLWRNKDGGYLFDHTALAKVFCAKMLAGIKQAGLKLPDAYPTKWVVDCKAVGGGRQALIYLGRYLYRGVIQEKDILSCDKGRHVPLSKQPNQADRNPHSRRRGIPAPDPATHPAQRLPPRPQLRLSAPQQQTDPVGATVQTCRAPHTATTPGDTL